MKKDILKYLCCPKSKNELKVTAYIEDDENFVEGHLTNGETIYKVKDGIANFISTETSLANGNTNYKRLSLPYDKILQNNGISPEEIFEMDALRYSIAKLIKKYVVEYANGVILDLGAGTNILKTKYLDKSTTWISLDYDLRANSIDIRGDGQKLPIKNDCIDTVISIDVLEHVPEPQRMIKEIWRVLKPGGVVILSTPFFFWHHEEPFDFHRFTKYGLRRIFQENKFSVIELSAVAGPIATFSFLFSVVIARLFSFSRTLTRIGIYINRVIQLNLILPFDKMFDKSGKMAQGHFIVAKKNIGEIV